MWGIWMVAMLQFGTYYTLVMVFRVINSLLRPPITGDTNHLATPVRTVYRIMAHPSLAGVTTVVDVGCGEGIAAVSVMWLWHKRVLAYDNQKRYVALVKWGAWLLRIGRVSAHQRLPQWHTPECVYFCVWTSWSSANRRTMIGHFLTHIPAGGRLVTVSHGIHHADFRVLATETQAFAWGAATVYYYQRL
jgi:hypothetical protein